MHKIKRICKNCNIEFERYRSLIQNNREDYCSDTCASEARLYNSRIVCTCKNCGTEFKITPSVMKNGGGKYCCKQCIIETRVGGFWYGNIQYYEMKYCELWNEDLKIRIRSFFNNTSVLSKKTKRENNNRNLSCHHVYYQKKACCEWDEDAQGYYAAIDGEKYYIKGDPNKFVTLTHLENCMVERDKLKWVRIFEDIINDQYDGKCYFTKKEYSDKYF